MAEISKTVDHALRVLVEVGERGPLTSAQIARDLGLNRTVVHRLVATLHGRGFVTRQQNGYLPGPLFLRVAERVQPELRATAAVAMRGLAKAVGETVVMHIPDGDEAVVLEQVVPDANVVRVEHQIGSRHPLAVGASGRGMLAFLGPEAIEPATRRADDRTSLERLLEEVRRLGYAVSHDELQHGIHGVAVPVLDPRSRAIASLAILVPTTRAGTLAEHVDSLTRVAAGLSATLFGDAVSVT